MPLPPLKASWPNLVNLSSPYCLDSPNMPHTLCQHLYSLLDYSDTLLPDLCSSGGPLIAHSSHHSLSDLSEKQISCHFATWVPILHRRKFTLPWLEGPYKSLQTWPCCPPHQLTSLYSHLPLPLSFCTHHGGSHVCAFTHVGCAAWHTFSISLHLNTIFWTHFRYLLLQEAFSDAQEGSLELLVSSVSLCTPPNHHIPLYRSIMCLIFQLNGKLF